MSLGGLYIIIGKYKKVLFASKVNKYNGPNKIGVDVLVRLCCSWHRVAIVLFLSFCLVIAIVDKFFYIIDEFDIVLCKIFFNIVRFNKPNL